MRRFRRFGLAAFALSPPSPSAALLLRRLFALALGGFLGGRFRGLLAGHREIELGVHDRRLDDREDHRVGVGQEHDALGWREIADAHGIADLQLRDVELDPLGHVGRQALDLDLTEVMLDHAAGVDPDRSRRSRGARRSP